VHNKYSIIQGSGVGPAAYTVTAGDLRPLNTDNTFIKFADDTYLGLPPVPDFPGCPGFAPCCPASRQNQPRDAKCPGFQGAVKMSTTIIITIVIIGVIVII